MPAFAQSIFPTAQNVLDLARSIVNDAFPGGVGMIPGAGRILTNDAPFTLPYLNSAFATLQRKLRNGGVTFPIKTQILSNVTPVAAVSSNITVNISYNGYFDGVLNNDSPKLPSDMMQPYILWEQPASGAQTNGWNRMYEVGALPGYQQSNWQGCWQWRNYSIYMPGSMIAENLQIQYMSGQPPIYAPPEQFTNVSINIADSTDALAYLVAMKFAEARGAADVTGLQTGFADALDDMIREYVRQSQTRRLVRGAFGTEAPRAGSYGGGFFGGGPYVSGGS